MLWGRVGTYTRNHPAAADPPLDVAGFRYRLFVGRARARNKKPASGITTSIQSSNPELPAA